MNDSLQLGDDRLPPRFWAKVAVDAAGCWLWMGARNHAGYGRFSRGTGSGRRRVVAHRVTFELDADEPEEVDHICRVRSCVNPAHLRAATRSENNAYRTPAVGCTSKFKGVSWRGDRSKWRAQGTVDRKKVHLGNFESEDDAARAYDDFARNTWGEFALLNFQEVART